MSGHLVLFRVVSDPSGYVMHFRPKSRFWPSIPGLIFAFVAGCGQGDDPGADIARDSFQDVHQADSTTEVADLLQDDPGTDSEVTDPADSGIELDAVEDGITETVDVPGEDVVNAGAFSVMDLRDAGDILAIWASAGGEVWAVGRGGLVLVRRNGQFVPGPRPPVNVDFHGVTGVDGAILVVGENGTVLKFVDGRWLDMECPVDVTLNAISCPVAGECFAVGDSGTIVHWLEDQWDVQDSGVAWDLFDVHSSVNGGTWVVGAFGSLFELSGTDWLSSQIAGTRSSMKSIWRSGDGTMFAVGTLGTIVMKRPGDLYWQQQLSNDGHDPQRDLFSVGGFDSDDVWVVGDSGVIIHYDGVYWKTATVIGPATTLADFRSVAVGPGGTVVAAGLRSSIAGLDAELEGFVDVAAGPVSDLRGVWVEKSSGADDDVAIFVGDDGLMLEYDRGRFSLLESGLDQAIRSVDGGIAVGDGGLVLAIGATDSDGTRYVSRIPGFTVEDLVDVHASGDGWVIAGADGSVFRMDSAMSVTFAGQVAVRLASVCRNEAGIWVAGANGTLSLLPSGNDEGQVFEDVVTFTRSFIRDLLPLPGGRVLAAGDNGMMLVCDTIRCDTVYQEPASFLYGLGAINRGDGPEVYAVGWAGRVVRFDGDSARRVESGTFKVFLAADGADSAGGRLFIAGSRGTAAIFTRNDGGSD